MKARLLIALLCMWGALAVAATEPAAVKKFPDGMRGTVPIAEQTTPPRLSNEENKDLRRARGYAMQPPTIPHKIDNYQIDRNFNQCMSCHARSRIEDTQAIPVSVTHYLDRDDNILGQLAPRRYFCTQCHVPQYEKNVLVPNMFEDIDTVLHKANKAGAAKK